MKKMKIGLQDKNYNFWDAKCTKPCFLVFSQKYWGEIPISYTVTSSGANFRAHSLTGSPQTSPSATHSLSLDHPPLAGAHNTHHHPVPTLGATAGAEDSVCRQHRRGQDHDNQPYQPIL